MLQFRMKALAALGVCALLVVAGTGVRCLTLLSHDLVRSGQLNEGLIAQTDVDMLHDTLRGDAYAAAETDPAGPQAAVARAEVTRHSRLLDQHLQVLAGMGLSPELRRAYRQVLPDLRAYAADVRTFVERPPASRAQAADRLRAIAAEFYALEPRLGAITSEFEREAAARRNLDLRSAADARLLVLIVGALGVLVFAGAAWAIAARIIAQNAELEGARRAADEGSRVKSEFLSAMSHEIRTPMNGILGMAQVMSRDETDPVRRQRLDVVRGSAETLLGILNNILDLSKVEAGELLIDNQEFELDELIGSTATLFRSLAAQKEIGLSIEMTEAARGLFWGDSLRLRQIVSNLLSNAIKFTAKGGVRLYADHALGMLEIRVEDDGVGIAADKLDTVFERFAQADSSTARRYGGAGLGLPLSREFARLLGGTLTVTSLPEIGSTFSLRIPLQRRAEQSAPISASPPAFEERPLRILAAEDNPTNRLILTALLQPIGAEIVTAEHGAEAVEAFLSGAFDLVLMDVQMPVLDGIGAARRIRALEREHGLEPTPIIALTANVMVHQIAEYRAAGMNAVVAKPIEAERLLEAIDAVLTPGEPQVQAA